MLALVVLVATVLFIVAQLPWNLGQSAPPAGGGTSVSHVFFIAMQDRGFHQIIGNAQAPYTNSLARTYGLATNYSALSQSDLPNHLQLIAGSNLGVTTNCTTCFVSAASLASEIENAGKTWKAYVESMPSNCSLRSAGSYLLYHNPFAYFSNLRTSCDTFDVPYTQFPADLTGGHTPNFVWIAPNALDDMEHGTIQQGDTWLSRQIPAILRSPAFQDNGVLFITWDEADVSSASNQVATLVISPLAKAAFRSSTRYNHYSLLRTIEDLLGVGPLGASAQARPMADFFDSAFYAGLSLNVVSHSSKASVQPSHTPGARLHAGILHVEGTQLIDSSGRPFILRGTQIASPLNFISGWQSGQDPTQFLNPAVFNAIGSWRMNALRLTISLWLYNADAAKYLGIVDRVMQQANAAGLYVILDNHDNDKSGSPYGTKCAVPKAEDVAFWRSMAAHYVNNPMVMFDLLNEPQGVTAQNWLYGGGTAQCLKPVPIVGFQPLVDAIRSTGARQIIIAPADVPAANPAIRIHDPDVMYTLHTYAGIGTGNPATWDQDWGSLLGHYPLYYGEWAVLPNSLVPAQCQPYTQANVDSDTHTFLNYMESRNISWTAWEFRAYYLIQDDTTFTPTTFQSSWVPCATNGQEGMGADVKNYLASAPFP